MEGSQPASSLGGAVCRRPGAPSRATYTVSAILAAVAILASSVSFLFWDVFHRDVPMTVGNMRGTALAMLVIAVPVLVGSMVLSSRGSFRARFVWLGAVAYIAYNAVMFCFALQFNSFFLLFAALLALAFWALVTLLTLETAGIAIDQIFGHLHDSSAPLGAVPIMGVLTVIGLGFSILFFRGMGARRVVADSPNAVAIA